MSTVESMEMKISSYLRRRLGLPQSLSSAVLYGNSNIMQTSFTSLKEEFTVSQTRELYGDSRELKVASAGIDVRMGRKLRATEALQVAESCLRQKDLAVNVATGLACCVFFHSTQICRAWDKDRCQNEQIGW